jgi:hypothetical protein
MYLAKTWLTAMLLCSVAVSAMRENLFAQTWQPVRPVDSANSPPNDWQQREPSRPQQTQWQPTQQSVNPSVQAAVAYSTSGQDQTVSQTSASSPVPQTASAKQATPASQTARRSAFDNVFDDAVPKEPAAPVRQRSGLASPTEIGGAEVIAPGEMQLEPRPTERAIAGPGGCARCDTSGGECNACDACGGPGCNNPNSCDFGYEIFNGNCGWWTRNLTLSAGAEGFKGPLDLGANGDFGLNEGLGFSGPLGDPWNIGYQIGVNFLQSNFARPETVVVDDQTFQAADRHQTFITGGLFRRALCGGLQGGVAYDYFHDSYYVQYDLQQIRSEIGWVFPCCEVGYYGAYGVSTARPHNFSGELTATDMFTLYVRHAFENGGEGRIWGGATGNGDGILGAELWVPLGRGFALENRVNFLIPNSTPTSIRDNPGQQRESWGLMIQLVWYPGQSALCQQRNLYRPLFSTADDSLFMVDRLTK